MTSRFLTPMSFHVHVFSCICKDGFALVSYGLTIILMSYLDANLHLWQANRIQPLVRRCQIAYYWISPIHAWRQPTVCNGIPNSVTGSVTTDN